MVLIFNFTFLFVYLKFHTLKLLNEDSLLWLQSYLCFTLYDMYKSKGADFFYPSFYTSLNSHYCITRPTPPWFPAMYSPLHRWKIIAWPGKEQQLLVITCIHVIWASVVDETFDFCVDDQTEKMLVIKN